MVTVIVTSKSCMIIYFEVVVLFFGFFWFSVWVFLAEVLCFKSRRTSFRVDV